MKKAIAVGLSMAMVLGMSVPAMAAEGDPVDTTAPIYSFDVMSVIVPTTYAVAFNPEGLTVKVGTGDTDTSTAQILSKNFGIINKSSKDKVVTATLTVTDMNTDSGITFVDSAQEVTSAKDGEYKIHLTVVPANTTEVKIGDTAADKDTAAADLNNVKMTGATGNAVTLKSGENKIGFKLEKAQYEAVQDSPVTLGTSNSNNVKDNYAITALAGSGKGITAFTFGGEMNANTDWTKLTNGIKITAVYTNETAPTGTTVITGTGALVELVSEPTFTTGSAVGTISYTVGKGDKALKSISKVEMTMPNGTAYDGYSAASPSWGAATDENGTITLQASYLSYYQSADADAATWTATVTYINKKDEEKTAQVEVKMQ